MMVPSWSTEQMPQCANKTIIITGANSGLGYEATKAFATKGATVIMACRSIERGQQAATDIRNNVDMASGDLTVRQCDLASLESIKSFAAAVSREYDSIDILSNNAGVMAIPRQETEDGFEKQFGVNHLGHFALTGHLLELMISGDDESRVVTHSSGAHEFGKINFDDLQRKQSYGKWEAYGQSKLANLLFAYELQRRFETAEITQTISVACHPGYAATNLQYRGPKQSGSALRLRMMKVANRIFGQSAADGVLPLLYASTATDVQGSEYYGPNGFLNMRGAPEEQSSSQESYDTQTAQRLWRRSETLTGVSFEFS
jgi:NAD(P)-dependent dehydrogenase (short-subunit alcohol dehydrogenase family)